MKLNTNLGFDGGSFDDCLDRGMSRMDLFICFT